MHGAPEPFQIAPSDFHDPCSPQSFRYHGRATHLIGVILLNRYIPLPYPSPPASIQTAPNPGLEGNGSFTVSMGFTYIHT